MKKITYFLFTFFIASTMMLNAQTMITETVVLDISGIETWDLTGDTDNINMTIPVDGLVNTNTPSTCVNPVLELTGVAWDVDQSSYGLSWLSEMTISWDANQDGTDEIFLTPSTTGAPGTNELNSSGGIVDLVVAGVGYLPIANATSGNIDMEYFEGYDDIADTADGIFNTGSTITIQYRLSCDNVLGVEESTVIENLNMYPNPIKDVLSFNAQDNIKEISIFNLLGQEVVKTSPNALETEIDMSNLNSGVYVVKIEVGEQIGTYKVVKE